MKKLINFLFVVVCVIMTTACESELKDMAYSYTNKSNGDVTVNLQNGMLKTRMRFICIKVGILSGLLIVG